MVAELPAVEMEQVTNPSELAKARARRDRFDRNWTWFDTHAAEIFRSHRGKCICISAEKLFAADTPAEVLALAKAAYPEDDGRFTGIIPMERLARIYAHQRSVAPVR